MFKAPSQEMLDHLLKKAINYGSGNTNCVSTLIVTFYDQVGNPIIGFCNNMVELKLIISFIDNKKYNQTNIFFSKLHEECCGESFYSYIINHYQKIYKIT